MELFRDGRILIYSTPVSFRYGLQGLTALTRMALNIDVTEINCWAIFINKARDALKIVHFTPGAGMLVHVKLRYGNKFPALVDSINNGNSITISRTELEVMLSAALAISGAVRPGSLSLVSSLFPVLRPQVLR